MRENELLVGPESSELPKVDALIILGRNFQPGYNRKIIAEQRFHLSPQSRINSLAGGLLHKAGLAPILMVSTGHTGGSNLPSEARGIQEHMQSIFPDIPDDVFLLEEKSIDTEENAKKVKELILQHPEYESFGLLSDTSHLVRAVPIFEDNGIQVTPYDSLKILGESRPTFIEQYVRSELYKKTIKQDRRAELLQTVPVLSPLSSRLLHTIALRMRNPNKPNPYVKAD